MEIDRMDDERWVDERLASLEPQAGWQPDLTGALERFRRRRAERRAHRRNTVLLFAAGLLIALVFADLTPRACANPRGCSQPEAAGEPVKLSPSEFKLAGSPRAIVTLEVYSDYQCPDCVAFFRTVYPTLQAEYIETGKIRFLHRDFPLPQHAYARLAARYANAAGQIGKYGPVTAAIFAARDDWAIDGNIAAAVSKALSPAEMKLVQRAVDTDPRLDETVTDDMTMARKDQIKHTPTLVIVSKTGRQVLTYNVSYEVLKSYLNAIIQ